jgi:ribosomal protein L11 methyltransferase
LIDLVIEPGMAFGTGQHATTRLCLEQIGLDAAENRGRLATRRVLDVGTGTGILAIGARKLGYAACDGTDIEDDAILAAVENARLNGVSLDFRLGSIPRLAGPEAAYDVVLANILAVVLIRIMDDLAAVTRPGGRLILSGLLVEEEDEVAARGAAAGLTRVRSGRHEGWSCLVLGKPGGR